MLNRYNKNSFPPLSRCCCRWFRSERLKSEIPSRTMRKKLRRRLIDEEVGDELYMPTDSIGIPIIVNIVRSELRRNASTATTIALMVAAN